MSEPSTVMISSTAQDLPIHREQVRLACQRAGFSADQMMENLTARGTNAVEVSLEMVEKADLYLGIFAYRYGHVPDGADISITEMEYNRAGELGKQRLIFFIHDDHQITGKDVETGEGATKLAALKERIGKELVVAFFESPKDLRGHVVEALVEWRKSREAGEPDAAKATAAKFHRRTAIPTPPAPYVAHPYTLLQVRDLVGRQDQLNAVTDWVANPDSKAFGARIFCFVAIGGMGKSALTWKWFQQVAPEEMNPLAGRVWWSFYESDASFESFLNRSLCYVSGRSEAEVRDLPWAEREAELLRYLDEQQFLFVLDGLERILLAYSRMDASYLADDDIDKETANRVAGAVGLPPSSAKSFIGQHRLRQTIDPRAGAFLRRLAQVKASRVLISTRLYPSELQMATGGPAPGCFAYFLAGLRDDDALGLWRALRVTGSRTDLTPIFRSVERHPLLVQALASEVASYRKAPGDFAKWRADHPQFDPTTLPLVQSRTHVLHYALTGLDDEVLEVLRNLVAFRMPATYDTLEALLVGADKTYPGGKGLDAALAELEDRGLIGWDREANRYDAHPIVRGVVWQQMSGTDRHAVYTALEAHFEPMSTPDSRNVESLEDLTPAIERYHTLVGLGRFDDAYSLFDKGLDVATLYRLAAHRERITWLEQLFPEGVEGATTLKVKHSLLNALALSYKSSGQPNRAVPLYKRALELIKQRRGQSAQHTVLINLNLALGETGALREALGGSWEALVLGRDLKDPVRESNSLLLLGLTLSATGEREWSHLALERSLHTHAREQHRQGQGSASAYLARRWLWLGDFTKAHDFADQARKLADKQRVENDFIRAALFQGQAAIGMDNLERADERLYHALTRARAVNLVQFELPVLIAIADLAIQRHDLITAKARLDEVWDAAERGPYPLHQANAYNLMADIAWAEEDETAAIDAATKAYRAAWCDGPPYAYHWGLETARAHLKAFSAAEPEMSPFDESKFEPLPEVEINPKDDYWVDPAALD